MSASWSAGHPKSPRFRNDSETTSKPLIEKDKSAASLEIEELLWRFSGVEFDERSWSLQRDGEVLTLEPRPIEILSYLLRHADELVTKEELLDAIWGRSADTISDKVLTNAIGKLRRALGDDQEEMIATVHRRGYRWVAPTIRVSVGRRSIRKLDAKPGDAVPGRPQWKLVRSFNGSVRSEVWLAAHTKTHEQRVFKFSPDGAGLSSLKREATLSRVLVGALGERPDFVRVREWNFEEAPFFIECDYGGLDWPTWAEQQAGLTSLALDDRLALLVQVAEAVGAAHQVGVLHKDIKPANVLIAPGGDIAWQVRLIDFGIGGMMDPKRLAALGITQAGFTQTQVLSADNLAGTPLYVAPELLAGQMPTQASDVYALGVLLYQVVVGDFRKPLSAGWERDVADELLREDIALAAAGDPAVRLDGARALAQRVSRLTQRRQERLVAIGRREAEELARAALQRARQRRPWMAALVVTLIAGLSVSLYFLFEAQHQFRRAWAVNEFMQEAVIKSANPSLSGRTDMTVMEALRRAEQDIDIHLAGQDNVNAYVRLNLAQAYQNLGAHDLARPQFEQALTLLQQAGRKPDDEILESLLHSGMAMMGQSPEGRSQSNWLADWVLPQLPSNDYFRGFAAFYQGHLAQINGDWAKALTLAETQARYWPNDRRSDQMMIRALRYTNNWTAAEQREAALLTGLRKQLDAQPRDGETAVFIAQIEQSALFDAIRLNRIDAQSAEAEWKRLNAQLTASLGDRHPTTQYHRAWGNALGWTPQASVINLNTDTEAASPQTDALLEN